MLRLPARRKTRLKCPRHPNQDYTEFIAPRRANNCDACQAIYEVLELSKRMDQADGKALDWINRTPRAS